MVKLDLLKIIKEEIHKEGLKKLSEARMPVLVDLYDVKKSEQGYTLHGVDRNGEMTLVYIYPTVVKKLEDSLRGIDIKDKYRREEIGQEMDEPKPGEVEKAYQKHVATQKF